MTDKIESAIVPGLKLSPYVPFDALPPARMGDRIACPNYGCGGEHELYGVVDDRWGPTELVLVYDCGDDTLVGGLNGHHVAPLLAELVLREDAAYRYRVLTESHEPVEMVGRTVADAIREMERQYLNLPDDAQIEVWRDRGWVPMGSVGSRR